MEISTGSFYEVIESSFSDNEKLWVDCDGIVYAMPQEITNEHLGHVCLISNEDYYYERGAGYQPSPTSTHEWV